MTKLTRPTKPLADVNVLPQADGGVEIVACFMPDPDVLVGEGESRAVLAVDASRSLKAMYGGGPFGAPNYVQAVSRKLGEILCGVARSGRVEMLNWALGAGGGQIETIGQFDAAGCQTARVAGPLNPKKLNWGTGTQILPAVKQIVEQTADSADWTMGVLITDGILEDEAPLFNYCRELGRRLVRAGKADSLKLVLIGVGEEIDREQMSRIDNMFEGTDLRGQIDLWSSGVAASMEDEDDIIAVLFGELWGEDKKVANWGRVFDPQGRQVASFADGLPGKFRFRLPRGCRGFQVQTPHGQIVQDISEAL